MTSQKTSKKIIADMSPSGIKYQHPKSTHADMPTNTRARRSSNRLVQDGRASTQREGMPDPKRVTSNGTHEFMACAGQAEEIVCNFDDHTQHGLEGKYQSNFHVLFIFSKVLYWVFP